MPVLIALLTLLPLVVGGAAEYAVCRLRPGWLWRLIPPAAGGILTALVCLVRWRNWTSTEVSPLTQILIFPVLPAIFLFLGMLAGWRIWKRLWAPRVVDDR